MTIFEGGATYEQIEALGGARGAESDLRSITSAGFAVYRPMRVGDRNRYWILEPVRHILKAYLLPEDRNAAQDGRLAHSVWFAQRALPRLGTANAIDWLVELESEHSNFRNALRWSLESRQPRLGLDLAVALFQFWNLHGHLSEGRKWLQDCLEAAGDDVPAALRAKALNRIASFDRLVGDYPAARSKYLQVVALAPPDSDPWNRSFAENGLGLIELEAGDPEAARRLFESSLDIRSHRGLRGGEAVCLTNLGDVAVRVGQSSSDARRLHNDALNIRLEIGDVPGIPITLLKLAQLDVSDSDPSAAARNLREAVLRFREINDGKSFPPVCELAASLAADSGRSRDAARLLDAAVSMRARYGVRRSWRDEQDVGRVETRIGRHSPLMPADSERPLAAAAALDLAVEVAEGLLFGPT